MTLSCRQKNPVVRGRYSNPHEVKYLQIDLLYIYSPRSYFVIPISTSNNQFPPKKLVSKNSSLTTSPTQLYPHYCPQQPYSSPSLTKQQHHQPSHPQSLSPSSFYLLQQQLSPSKTVLHYLLFHHRHRRLIVQCRARRGLYRET